MSVKLTFGEPMLVAMGPDNSVGWGPYQFPNMKRQPDGKITIHFHDTEDSCEAYGTEKAWAVSEDNGLTWSRIPKEDIPKYKLGHGVPLPSGKYIRVVNFHNHPVDKEYYKQFPGRAPMREGFAIPSEDLPDDMFPKTFAYGHYDPETGSDEVFFTELDFPGMNIYFLKSGALVRPQTSDALIVAPDGSLWDLAFGWHRNPENLGHTSPYFGVYFFQSWDEGKSFKLKGWIQYVPDTNEFPKAFLSEGFCEPHMFFAKDGSMVTLMRTGTGMPSYISRSTDGGCTWSKPVKFDDCGVYPQTISLGCGVTLAAYGRPCLYVRATDDPQGMIWDDPIKLMHGTLDTPIAASCYYTTWLALDERTALLTYTDFHIKDEEGVDRKCIMVRTVRVEE